MPFALLICCTNIFLYNWENVLGKCSRIPRKNFERTAKRYRKKFIMTHGNLCESIKVVQVVNLKLAFTD